MDWAVPFSRLGAGVAVCRLGDGMRLVAMPLLVASITPDPGLVAGLTVGSINNRNIAWPRQAAAT